MMMNKKKWLTGKELDNVSDDPDSDDDNGEEDEEDEGENEQEEEEEEEIIGNNNNNKKSKKYLNVSDPLLERKAEINRSNKNNNNKNNNNNNNNNNSNNNNNNNNNKSKNKKKKKKKKNKNINKDLSKANERKIEDAETNLDNVAKRATAFLRHQNEGKRETTPPPGICSPSFPLGLSNPSVSNASTTTDRNWDIGSNPTPLLHKTEQLSNGVGTGASLSNGSVASPALPFLLSNSPLITNNTTALALPGRMPLIPPSPTNPLSTSQNVLLPNMSSLPTSYNSANNGYLVGLPLSANMHQNPMTSQMINQMQPPTFGGSYDPLSLRSGFGPLGNPPLNQFPYDYSMNYRGYNFGPNNKAYRSWATKSDGTLSPVDVCETKNGEIVVYGWYEPLTDSEKNQICWEWGNRCQRGRSCNWRHWDAPKRRDILTRWRPTGFVFGNESSVMAKYEDPPRLYGPTENDPTVAVSDLSLSGNRSKIKIFGENQIEIGEDNNKSSDLETIKDVMSKVYSALKKFPRDDSINSQLDKILELFNPISSMLPSEEK